MLIAGVAVVLLFKASLAFKAHDAKLHPSSPRHVRTQIAAVKFRNNLNMFATGLAALVVAAVIVYVVFSVLTNSKSL